MTETKQRIERHKDGSIRAKGQTIDGFADGYWEWFRKDRTRLRSGHFAMGRQTGEWTTYDSRGEPYKVTTIKPAEPGASKPLTRL